MVYLICLLVGLLAGLLIKRIFRALLLERIRGLPLIGIALASFLLPAIFNWLWPDLLWRDDRQLLVGLQAFAYILSLLAVGLNLLPWTNPEKPKTQWFHRAPLALVGLGLLADALVVILNQGYMPISSQYLSAVDDPITVQAILNEALYLKQLAGPDTLLPWLGQVVPLPILKTLRLAVFPYLSAGEIAISSGLLLFGLAQFFAAGDLTGGKPDDILDTSTTNPQNDSNNSQSSARRSLPMARKPFFSRPDGVYLKKIDPFMRFFPYMMKGRNESAIYFKLQADITALRQYINKRNHDDLEQIKQTGKVTLFHAILTALAKSAVERPQVNRFVIGRRVYQRNDMTCAFVIKSEFKDDANEEIAIMKFEQDDNLSSVSQKLAAEVKKIRDKAKEEGKERHGAVNWLNYFMMTPRIVLRGFMRFMGWLDYHGWMPKFVCEADPMHASFFVSNLGSLHIDAPFHHLYEWGTTSVFMTIGKTEKTPVARMDKTIEVRDTVNIALTMDERITDGFYLAKTLRRFEYFLEHPEELEIASVPNLGRPIVE